MAKTESPPPADRLADDLSKEIGEKELRKLRARREKHHTVWQGFRMFGLVGWPIAVSTAGGALLGLFLDRRYPSRASWTLNLLLLGLAVGCLYAWNWVQKERRGIHERPEELDDDRD